MFGNEDKALRNNTAIITCSHSFLSFEVIKWLFYHLLFRWILCKKQLLTTRLECPFPQRRNKLFLVMSASFALIRMWVSPLSCSLQSVKLEVWLFWILTSLHMYILSSSHSSWWPTYFSMPGFPGIWIQHKKLEQLGGYIKKNQGFL